LVWKKVGVKVGAMQRGGGDVTHCSKFADCLLVAWVHATILKAGVC
jgi:hypothetical protein